MKSENPKGHLAKIILAVIMAVSLGLMINSSVRESATMDELAHIPSGYAYVAERDYRLNPEHPPLVKILSAIPLFIHGFNFPTNIPAWTEYVNGQWDMGTAFIYQSSNDADAIIQLSRIGPMILALLLIVITFVWSKEIMGEKWALLPAAAVALSPNFLAHGHLVTTDIGAAFGVVASTYFFVKSLEKPTIRNITLAGIFFGIAQLLKFSLFLLLPYFVLLSAIYGTAKAIRTGGSQKLKAFLGEVWIQIRNFTAIVVIGYLLMYPVYFITTRNYPIERQVADTKYILASAAGGPDESACAKLSARCPAELTIKMAGSPILRPYAQYMLGFLMVTQRASGGNTGYFMGEVSAGGWRAYFPVIYALKEPLPLLLLAILGIALAKIRFFKKPAATIGKRIVDYLGMNFTEFSCVAFIVIYSVISIRSPLNIGIRHLMPILPLIYILSAVS
ncbi:MAG: glycosyltransferase family 39 protein [Candidatus Colwellbacteria bacterium]|nr:glycosyltransferase family 39 protein [Candidatus Colwellbacteria bacterium]